MSNGDIEVFENKHPKLVGFATGLLMLVVFLTVFLGSMIFRIYAKTRNLNASLFLIGIAAAVSLIAGLCSAAKAKKITVKIIGDTVDITVGKAHGTYPVRDYKGSKIYSSGGRSRTIIKELIFKDSEYGTNLTIELPNTSNKLFAQIADAIEIRRHELYESDEEYVPFEGDVYEGVKPPYTLKAYLFIGIMLVIEMIVVGIFAGVFLSSGATVERTDKLFMGGLLVLITVSLLTSFLLLFSLDKDARAKSITSLKTGSLALTVNGEEFAYRDIQSITMTPPYLPEVTSEYRTLTLELKNAEKPRKFYLGKRPSEKKTEEQLSGGCSCIYSAIYERLRTDPHTTALFKR